MPLVKSKEIVTTRVRALFYGQPGIGKSTFALSIGGNPLLIDFDKGASRVSSEHRPEQVFIPDNWKDVISFVNSQDVKAFDTVICDGFNSILQMILDDAMRANPRLKMKDGTPQLKAYGVLSNVFKNFVAKLDSLNMNQIYIAHEKEEKEGDTRVRRPQGVGSSINELIKDMDAVGYMSMNGDKRTVNFNPSETFYAKNSLGLDGYINLPNLKLGESNSYLETVFAKALEQQKKRAKDVQKYQEVVSTFEEMLAKTKDLKGCNKALAWVKETNHILTSKQTTWAMLQDKGESLNLTYDKPKGEFIKIEDGE